MTDCDSAPGREPGSHPESFTGLLTAGALLTAVSSLALLLTAGACLLLSFFFALFESALRNYSRVRLSAGAKRLGTEAALDAVLLKEDDILFASKVGHGLCQAAGIATVVVALIEAAPTGLAAIGWAILVAGLFLLVSVSGPYLLGLRFADGILLRWLLAYERVTLPLRPLCILLGRLAGPVLGNEQPPNPVEEMSDEIRSAIEEGSREGTLEASEKRMLEGVMDLREVNAEHIMTPRTEMVCVPVETTPAEAIERSQGRGLARLPVYRDTPDDIVGVLYMKDLLPFLGRETLPPIERLLRQPFFVPQSKNVGDLLQEMRAKHVHMAIVLDEYGGTAGIVTIEDIIEEIVGEIVDEHESEDARMVVKINENAATVAGRAHIDDLNRALDLDVPESEEYETIGGLLFNRIGHVPTAGEHVDLDGIRFTVLEADERRIQRVKVTVQRR